MSNPRSSRRRSARVATLHVNVATEDPSSPRQSELLSDRVSGAGPPALSLIRNADLAEVPGSFANDQPSLPTFDSTPFEFAVVGHSILSSRDRWTLQLIGARFRYKEEELEDDVDFRDKHPSNLFIIHSIVTYNALSRQFVAANNRYSKRNLHFIFYSVDDVNDFEIAPVASFEPTLQERRRFYVFYQSSETSQSISSYNVASQNDEEDCFGAFMQGVTL